MFISLNYGLKTCCLFNQDDKYASDWVSTRKMKHNLFYSVIYLEDQFHIQRQDNTC